MKNAVFVGKDRQSDLLAWLTVSETVQEALRQLEYYQVQRVPEKYVPYKSNAATQKKIIYPVDVCCNQNGDVFVLDAGSACLHIIDRSVVAIVHIIGKYNSPSTAPYASNVINKRSRLMFSRDLRALSINSNDDLAISDAGREEVVLVKGCRLAKTKSNFYLFKVNRVLSVALSKKLFVLRDSEEGKVVQLLSFEMPSIKSATKKFYVTFEIAMEIPWDNINTIFAVPFRRCLGIMDQDNKLRILYYSKSKPESNFKIDLDMNSLVKPSLSVKGSIVSVSDSNIYVSAQD